ncbi:MAG: dipeptidase [Clostridia bacterium]
MDKKRIIVDAHCDTLKLALDMGQGLTSEKLQFNLRDVKRPHLQFMALYVNPKFNKLENGGYIRARNVLDKFVYEYEKHKDVLIQIKNKADLQRFIYDNKIGVLLTIENGDALNGDLSNIYKFYEKGVRVMSLTWNYDTALASGALSKTDMGITNLGKQCIRIMNEKDIIIDISHLSYKGSKEVFSLTDKNIIATHSCVDKLHNHPRNLKDEQIKAIAKSGGVVGIAFANEFMTNKKYATSEDIVNNIDYIANLVGIDYVGIGSDFDGLDEFEIPVDIQSVKNIDIIFKKLKCRGYRDEDIDKIAGANFIRVLKNNLK